MWNPSSEAAAYYDSLERTVTAKVQERNVAVRPLSADASLGTIE